MLDAQNKVAVIFAGGSGKRLWPLSTANSPKQINQTLSKKSMLVEAYNRALRLFDKKNIIVVTTAQLLKATRKLLPLDDKNLIVQPKNADTASAMCLAAMYIETLFPDSIAVFMYSDHYINDEQKFDQAILDAIEAVQNRDQMMIVGTRPSFANTGFGYIKMGKMSDHNVYKVDSFKEKPSHAVAQRMVNSGNWLWNTGIKVWRIATLLKAIKMADPKMYDMLLDLRTEIGGSNYWSKLECYYNELDAASFESVIATKLPQLYVLRANYAWDDVGDWLTIYKLGKKNKAGNVIKTLLPETEIKILDSKNSLVMSTTNQKIVLIEVEDLMIVQTKAALLVCKSQTTPRVKEVAE